MPTSSSCVHRRGRAKSDKSSGWFAVATASGWTGGVRPTNQASLASVGTGPGRRAPTRFLVIVVRSPSSVRKLCTGQPVAVRSRRARERSPRRPPGSRWRLRHCRAAAEPPFMAPTPRVASREFGLRCRRFAGVGLVGHDGASGAQSSRTAFGVARFGLRGRVTAGDRGAGGIGHGRVTAAGGVQASPMPSRAPDRCAAPCCRRGAGRRSGPPWAGRCR